MPAVLTKNGDQLELSLSGCRGSEFQDAKEKVKEIPGRRFDFDSKLWIVPADPANAERMLKTIQPLEASDELRNWVVASKITAEENLTTPLPDDANLLLPWATQRCSWQPYTVNEEKFNGLLPYQRAAVNQMAKTGRAILADDMGLGKTFEGISAVEEWCLRHGQPDGPRLVIAPASVKGGWARELKRWLEDPPVAMIDAATPARREKQLLTGIEENAWVIVNWEQLRVEKVKVKKRNGGTKTVTQMKQPLFQETDWLAVLADEIHRAKNKDAQQTKGLWRVQGSVMFGLTGTPIMNSPDEIWSILRWLWPQEYHERGAAVNAIPYWSFYDDYVEYYEDHFGKKIITGVKNPDALRFVLKGKLIRRTASILGLKGRKRIYDTIPLNSGQRKLYEEAERVMWLEVAKDAEEGDANAASLLHRLQSGEVNASTLYRIPNGAARMVRLQQIIENPALLGGDDDSAIMDFLEDKMVNSGGEPWVFFFRFKESTELMAERLRKKYGYNVAVYHGDVTPSDRTAIEDEFQRGELDAVCGTIAAMKEGITLTASHLMGFGSRDFVPDINEQCEAREDRLGQQELVRVYIPLAEDTVATDRVEPINQLKEQIVRTVLPKIAIKEARS
jgi:SNF2 family DNA or RNA helicase